MKITFSRPKNAIVPAVKKAVVTKVNFAGVQFTALQAKGLQIPVYLGKL